MINKTKESKYVLESDQNLRLDQKIMMNLANADSRRILMIVSLATILMVGSWASLSSFVQAEESDVTTKEVDNIIQKTANGKSVIEKQKIEVTFKQIIVSKIPGCDIAEGTTSAQNKTSKIMPDLQRVLDSETDEVCIVIKLPFYEGVEQPYYDVHPKYYVYEFPIDPTKLDPNKKYLTYAEANDKRRELKAEFSSKTHSNYRNVIEFLKENDARIESTYKSDLALLRASTTHYPISSFRAEINAAINSDVIDKLVLLDDVVAIDLYGKKISLGIEPKKIFPSVQAHLDIGLEITPVDINIHQEYMWKNGWPSSTYPTPEERSIRSKEVIAVHHQRQQPILDFLSQNNIEPHYISDGTGIISAHVPSSLVLELAKIEQVDYLYYAGAPIQSQPLHPIPTIPDMQESTQDKPVKIVLNDDSAIFHISDDSVGMIPIPDSITTDSITVMINNSTVHNYSVTSDTPRLIIFDKINMKPNQNSITEKQDIIPSVREQLQNGILSKDIQCKKDNILILKSTNGNPYCVTPFSAEKLQHRGWGVIQ